MNVMNAQRLFTVKEVCDMYEITRKTLFYYDRAGLVKPAYRAGSQQYKLYDQETIEQLEQVLLYRSAGLTVRETRKILSNEIKDEQEIMNFLNRIKERLLLEKEEKETEIVNLEKIISRFPAKG